MPVVQVPGAEEDPLLPAAVRVDPVLLIHTLVLIIEALAPEPALPVTQPYLLLLRAARKVVAVLVVVAQLLVELVQHIV